MNSIRPSSTMIHLRHLVFSSAMLLLTSSTWAASNVGGPGNPDPNQCGRTGAPTTNSLTWNIDAGLVRTQKATSFIGFAQTAFENNGNLPDFNDLFGRVFSAGPLQQRQLRLEIFEPNISAALFHPSVIFFQSEALFETLKKPAASGFPEFIHQIVTDDAFTLIDLLSAPASGWRLRVWKKNAIAPAVLTKVNGYYVTTGFEALPSALTDVTFKRPEGSSGDNTLLYLQNETSGVSGTHTITSEIAQTLDANGKPQTVISKVFAGSGTGGALLSQENVTYSARGSKVWDYTIARIVQTASVNAAGTVGALVTTRSTLENYDDFSPNSTGGLLGMKRLMSLTEAYNIGGQTPQTTTNTYVNTPDNGTTHGRLATSIKADGSWTSMEYAMTASSPVSIITEYSGWKDLTISQKASARKTVTEISANSSAVETTIAGQLVSKSKITLVTGGSELLTTAERWDGSAWHTTTTGFFSDSAQPPNTGRIKWIENADGTATTYSYATVSGELVVTERTGAGNRSGITAGNEVKTTFNLGNFPNAQTTKDIASALVTEQWVTDLSYNGGFDPMGRPIKRIYNADVNDFEITQHACCGLEFSRDRMGATFTYSRDGLKRVYRTVTKASTASPEVTTFTTVTGLTSTRTRSIGGQSLFLGSQTTSMDGLTRSSIEPSRKSTAEADRLPTTTVTARSATGDTVTTTFADLSTAVTASYLDGRVKSTSGTAVPDMTYDYATHNENGGGEKSITTASGVVTTRFTDLFGRSSKTLSGAIGTTLFGYYPLSAAAGSRGKLQSATDGDNVALTYGYNTEGERTTTSRTIPLASGTATQVTTSDQDVVSNVTLHGVSLGTATRTIQTISSTGIAPITTSETFVSLDRLTRGARSLSGDTLSIVTRPDAAGIATQTTTNPDGTKSRATSQHGLMMTAATLKTDNSAITSTSYTYDSLQRLLTSTDARTGTTHYDLNADGQADVTESGQLLAMRSPANHTTSFDYDIMGRLTTVDSPDTLDANGNALANISYTAYYPTGQIKATWGSQAYPTWTVYDEQNRRTQLHTWKVAPALALATIPATPPAGSEVTTWIYGPATGLLDRKQYADTKGTDYTYTAAGRLQTRTWARGVTTTYGYTQGLMTSTDYSDTTPDVTITYEPLGRQQSISTSLAKSEFTYDPATLAIDIEAISYNLDAVAGYEFFRLIDRRPTSLGRDTGFDLKNGTTVEASATYAYSPSDGRLQSVADAFSGSFSYQYLPNGNLIEKVTGPVHTVTNTWEPNRDVLDIKENKVGTDVVSKYDYAVNAIGQRTGVATSGTAFPALPTWLWGYDSLGQVVSADSSVSTSDRSYQYDTIGNRRKSADSLTLPSSDNYTANALNQYSSLALNSQAPTLNPSYDFDGNMTSGPLPTAPTVNSTLTWDAENRLTSTTVSNVTTTTLYDAQSRRIAKTTGGNNTLYLYDGWNCIAEYSRSVGVSPTLQTTRLWGTDLSGTFQGAGGVGGLLCESHISNPQSPIYYPTYDANGNVSEYLASSGSIAAHYEYDPFGNTVINTDSSNQFGYRFSTKPRDSETGLYYYGYRYYDPATGRWPSRDPIEEEGGWNLYGFVENNPNVKFDLLGQRGGGKTIDAEKCKCKGGEVMSVAECKEKTENEVFREEFNKLNSFVLPPEARAALAAAAAGGLAATATKNAVSIALARIAAIPAALLTGWTLGTSLDAFFEANKQATSKVCCKDGGELEL